MTTQSLHIEAVTKKFGGVTAVSGLTLEAAPGVTGLIGPNGAGKSTAFNLVTGLIRPDEGTIRLGGQDLTQLPPHRIAELGIRRTFQNIRLFAEQTVLDNVAVGALRTGHGKTVRSARRAAGEVLDRMRLQDHRSVLPHELPYALQRRVEIARCLAAEPKVLLLDEPAAGMHATERAELVTLIKELGEQDLIVMLVEHDVGLVSAACRQIVVMDFGRRIAAGTPDEIRNDPRVIDAYLGAGTHD